MPQDVRRQDAGPLVSPGDLALMLTEPAHALMARTVPPALSDAAARRLAALALRVRPGKRAAFGARYRQLIGGDARMPAADDYLPALVATYLRQRTAYARVRADADWAPENLVVEGAEAVAASRAAGRGAVLWLLPQEMVVILTRIACRQRGWPLDFVSLWSHGQSDSRLGRALFNARDCRAEERFGRRLVISPDGAGGALKAAHRILREGGLVGFRGIGRGARPQRHPLFGGYLNVAMGAPRTARAAGADLYVGVLARRGGTDLLRFEPMDAARPLDVIGAEFAARLEAAVIDSPALWGVKSPDMSPGDRGDAAPG